jgi:hypothetical protein
MDFSNIFESRPAFRVSVDRDAFGEFGIHTNKTNYEGQRRADRLDQDKVTVSITNISDDELSPAEREAVEERIESTLYREIVHR